MSKYEDEMVESDTVRTDREYDRLMQREIHEERMALLYGGVCHTPVADAITRADGGGA